MSTIEYIKHALRFSHGMTYALLDDMKSAPLQYPTSNGGNHPLWILGHLTYAEANIVEHLIQGNENPLVAWKGLFGAGSQPSDNAADYPSWDELRAKADEVRQNTMALVESLSDADLDRPSKNFPPGREEVFGTIGKCLLMLTLHPVAHRGQLADSRRMASRPPVFG